jgi:hypothetical protein
MQAEENRSRNAATKTKISLCSAGLPETLRLFQPTLTLRLYAALRETVFYPLYRGEKVLQWSILRLSGWTERLSAITF